MANGVVSRGGAAAEVSSGSQRTPIRESCELPRCSTRRDRSGRLPLAASRGEPAQPSALLSMSGGRRTTAAAGTMQEEEIADADMNLEPLLEKYVLWGSTTTHNTTSTRTHASPTATPQPRTGAGMTPRGCCRYCKAWA